jgi:hypothetical protein
LRSRGSWAEKMIAPAVIVRVMGQCGR